MKRLQINKHHKKESNEHLLGKLNISDSKSPRLSRTLGENMPFFTENSMFKKGASASADPETFVRGV